MRTPGAVVALLVVVSACAPKTIPAPVVTTPRFPEFVRPAVPPSLAGTPAAVNEDRAWRFLQTGDLKAAEREYTTALVATPAFYPANAGLGYVELANRNSKDALTYFDRALEQQKDYVPALVGRGEALIALGRDADALPALEAAVAADPSLTDISRRIEVLKFRSLEQNLAAARQAAKAGKLDEAERAYASATASSPDSPFLYRELAAVERQKGENDKALEHFQKSIELDPADAGAHVQVGDLLAARGDLEGAAKAYTDALAIDRTPDTEAKLDSVQARIELARLPEEYRAIEQAPELTRADLAALIGVRLAPLVQAARRRDPVLITDARNDWAATWIQAVARAGIMEPFENHTFQPRAVVRRVDLAQVVSHVLARIATTNPTAAKAWQAARLRFADLSPGHLAYPAASAAVASGVMTVGPDQSFQPSRLVTGAEAVEAVDRLDALAGSTRERGRARR